MCGLIAWRVGKMTELYLPEGRTAPEDPNCSQTSWVEGILPSTNQSIHPLSIHQSIPQPINHPPTPSVNASHRVVSPFDPSTHPHPAINESIIHLHYL